MPHIELKIKMKKVNPKVVSLVTMLLALLISGGIAAERVLGEATFEQSAGDTDDTAAF